MKTAKYNYSKAQNSFFDSINNQQSRFYTNIMMPISQQQQMPKRANIFLGNESAYHAKGAGPNNQNGGHYFEQQMNLNGIGLSNHNNSSGRQRFAPYPFYKRSYAHTLVPPMNQRFYNYQQQSQQSQTMSSSNLLNISDQGSPADASFRLVDICLLKHFNIQINQVITCLIVENEEKKKCNLVPTKNLRKINKTIQCKQPFKIFAKMKYFC